MANIWVAVGAIAAAVVTLIGAWRIPVVTAKHNRALALQGRFWDRRQDLYTRISNCQTRLMDMIGYDRIEEYEPLRNELKTLRGEAIIVAHPEVERAFHHFINAFYDSQYLVGDYKNRSDINVHQRTGIREHVDATMYDLTRAMQSDIRTLDDVDQSKNSKLRGWLR